MESIASVFEKMNQFFKIPNKKYASDTKNLPDVWPKYGSKCEINLFFRKYSSAEGWFGDGYLSIWTREEVILFEENIREIYPEIYHFFASDGGGTQFGFFDDGSEMLYVSAPNIGSIEDMRILGGWDQFLTCLNINDYI